MSGIDEEEVIMTCEEIEKRFEEINARTQEVLTPEEEESLAHAEAVDDGTVVAS